MPHASAQRGLGEDGGSGVQGWVGVVSVDKGIGFSKVLLVFFLGFLWFSWVLLKLFLGFT